MPAKKKLHHPVPATLGKAGRAVWESIATEYELRPDELVTLEDVCAFSDEIADLTADWVEQGRPRTTKGSMGQLVEHPHPKRLADLRMKRNTLWRQLNFPDLESGVPANQHRAAANASHKPGVRELPSWQPGVRGRGA